MQVPGFLVKSQQDVDLIAEGWNRFHASAQLEHYRPAFDLGGISAKGVDMVSTPGHRQRQHIARRDGVVDARFTTEADKKSFDYHFPSVNIQYPTSNFKSRTVNRQRSVCKDAPSVCDEAFVADGQPLTQHHTLSE
jgi:hypothetical protein